MDKEQGIGGFARRAPERVNTKEGLNLASDDDDEINIGASAPPRTHAAVAGVKNALVPETHAALLSFELVDTNHDGKIDQEEFTTWLQSENAATQRRQRELRNHLSIVDDWRTGDHVVVSKEGSQLGNEAVVVDPSWGGRVKVKMKNGPHAGSVKSYAAHELAWCQGSSELLCPLQRDAEEFKHSVLGIEPSYLNRKYNQCFCAQCYGPDLPDVVPKSQGSGAGKGGAATSYDACAHHVVPRGWFQFGLFVPQGRKTKLDIFTQVCNATQRNSTHVNATQRTVMHRKST
jgi:hypothetical protein